MPIDGQDWVMQQVARDPLVVCMQKEDPLARNAQVSLSDLAERLKYSATRRCIHPRTID